MATARIRVYGVLALLDKPAVGPGGMRAGIVGNVSLRERRYADSFDQAEADPPSR
jgi:hypothetical protein